MEKKLTIPQDENHGVLDCTHEILIDEDASEASGDLSFLSSISDNVYQDDSGSVIDLEPITILGSKMEYLMEFSNDDLVCDVMEFEINTDQDSQSQPSSDDLNNLFQFLPRLRSQMAKKA